MRILALAILTLALAACGSSSPYSDMQSYSDSYGGAPDATPVVVAPAPSPTCTAVRTTAGYLVYRC